MKIEAILFVLTHEFKPDEVHAACCWEEKFIPATERSGNKRHVTPEKLLL